MRMKGFETRSSWNFRKFEVFGDVAIVDDLFDELWLLKEERPVFVLGDVDTEVVVHSSLFFDAEGVVEIFGELLSFLFIRIEDEPVVHVMTEDNVSTVEDTVVYNWFVAFHAFDKTLSNVFVKDAARVFAAV